MLDSARIAALIPHAGAMSLLERVIAWDAASIRCAAVSHRETGNPLARDGVLSALCAIEYAAQAMAVHGGLCASHAARPLAGYLASLRDVVCHMPRVDRTEHELIVNATQLMRDEARIIYEFSVSLGDVAVVSGRATVVLDVEMR